MAVEAERLHAAVCDAWSRACPALEGGRFERRPGYVWTICPTVPVPAFNSVWPEDDSCAPTLSEAVAEIAALGLPYAVMTWQGRTPACELAVESMGLIPNEELPAMAVTSDGLQKSAGADLEVLTVATADELAQALAVAAEGFAVPPKLFAPLYDEGFAGLDGLRYYLGRVDNVDVTTATGYTVGDAVGIFNVATPEEHRGRGYGAAVTAKAVRDGFHAGAEFAWLQSSPLGHSVYRSLGFRDVGTYVLHTAPEAAVDIPI